MKTTPWLKGLRETETEVGKELEEKVIKGLLKMCHMEYKSLFETPKLLQQLRGQKYAPGTPVRLLKALWSLSPMIHS